MADEPAQAPDQEVQDSPDVEAPEVEDSPQGEETNWEQRFKDTQSAFTKSQQQNAQYEQLIQNLRDEELGAQLLPEIAPWAYESEDDDEYGEDEPNYVTKDEFQQFQQGQQREAALVDIQDHVDELAGGTDVKLTDRDKQWLVREIFETPGVTKDRGEEIFKAFVDEREQRDQQVIEGYRESKKAPQAPGGTAAIEIPDLDDDQARQQWMAERWKQAQEN